MRSVAPRQVGYQNVALFLLVLGVLAYIFVDSGLFGSNESRNISRENLNPNSTQEGLLKYSRQLQSELEQVEKEMKTEKKKLSKLQAEVATNERHIQTQRKNLKQLNEEIKNLSNLKTFLDDAKKSIATKSNRQKELKESVSELSSLPAVVFARDIRTEQDLAQAVSSVFTESAEIVPYKYQMKDYSRAKVKFKYDANKEYLLTATGIRQLRTLVEGAEKLGRNNFVVAYEAGDQLMEERSQVIRNFLKEVYKDRFQVARLSMDKSHDLKSGLEIWFNKDVEDEQN